MTKEAGSTDGGELPVSDARVNDPRYMGAELLSAAADEIQAVLDKIVEIGSGGEVFDGNDRGQLAAANGRITELAQNIGRLSRRMEELIAQASSKRPNYPQPRDALRSGILADVLDYLRGTTDELPVGYSTETLSLADQLINFEKHPSKDFARRMKALQPQIASAEQEDRLGKNVGYRRQT